ncbi:MAG: DUF4249 domain-containing protein [bacterium]|nr:DUF4249 domain-containing protein [bacterium]
MMKAYLLTIIALFTALSACEVYEQDSYEEYYVVESYLVANRQLPQVRVSTTAPVNDFYAFTRSAIADAQVQIRLLDPSGSSIEEVFTYTSDSAGIYQPMDTHDVLPTRSYQLYVTIPTTSAEITATTVVPDTFKVISTVLDTLVYQSTEQLEITVSESTYPGRQNIFIFNTIALDPDPAMLTPIYADFLEDEIVTLDELTNTESGLLNAANFTVNQDQSITIRYPWIAVAFYGDNKLIATTVDDNVYDFVRSESVQLGGSTLSPGEIQNVITHVEGGLGIFGSLASDTIQTYIKPFEF